MPEWVRSGLVRGVIELRHSLPLVLNYVFFPSIAVVVMFVVRGVEIGGSGISVGLYAVPGVLAMNVVLTGLMGLATTLMTEREDGTLLRARSVPHGIAAYLVGKVVSQLLLVLVTMAVVLAEVLLLFDGFAPSVPGDLVTLLWLVPLGMLAMLPWGAVAGSLVPHPRHLSLVSLALMGVVAVSGIFYPVSRQGEVMQWLAQASPLSWLARGLRGSLLPDGYAVLELGGSWGLAEVAAVLGVWAVLGSALAVPVLRRAARRQAGSRRVRAAPAARALAQSPDGS